MQLVKRGIALATLLVASVATAGCAAEAPASSEEGEVGQNSQALRTVAVSDAAYKVAKDDPSIDRSALTPGLRADYTWKCFRERGNVSCLGVLDEGESGWGGSGLFCQDGSELYYNQGGIHSISYRAYNSENKLTKRVLHESAPNGDKFSANPDGSGKTSSGGLDAFFEDVLVVPGDFSAVSSSITGLDAIQVADQGPHPRLIFIDHGKLTVDPEGNFTIHHGRWDLWTDFDGAVNRLCARLQ